MPDQISSSKDIVDSSETSAGQSVPSELFSADKNSEVININGRSFRRTTWNEIVVIQDVETGYYQASKICKDNGKKLKHWLENKRTDELLEAYASHLGKQIKNSEAAIPTSVQNVLIYQIKLTGNELVKYAEYQGWFVHPKLVHHIAEWASIDYAIKVEEIMNLINEQNKLLNQTLEDTISKLRSENVELKATIQDLTTPINKLHPSTIYASPVEDKYFQLRYSQVPISVKVKSLRSIEIVNAFDVKEQVMKQLIIEGLIETKNHKNRINTDHLDYVFDLISSTKINNKQELNINDRDKQIDMEMDLLKSKPQTSQIEGKLFELEMIKVNTDMIPWNQIPKAILNNYNEHSKDTGIDAVKIKDNKISEIIQIKKVKGYLSKQVIINFINKCKLDKYNGINKTLYVHADKISKYMREFINNSGIDIVEI